MQRTFSDKVSVWLPAALGIAALVALLGALVVRGGTALWFLVLFALLLPAALSAALIRWWPGGGPRTHPGIEWRRNLILCGAGLLLAAMFTLLLGIAWTGGRLGNMLLVAGTVLLPPAAIVAALGWLAGRTVKMEEEVGEEESIEYRAREHWGVLLPPAGVAILALLCVVGPFGIVGYSAAGVLYILVLPATAVSALGAYLNTEFALTHSHLLLARGLFFRRVVRIPRSQIEACGVKRTWLGQLLGYGRLSLVCTDGRSYAVRGIRDPEALRRRITD